MSVVEYKATTVRVPGHELGKVYTMHLGVESARYRFQAVKDVQRSLSGRAETLTHGVDTIWSVTFERAAGADLLHLREFLDSIADGQTFLLWLANESAAPIELRRRDTSHTLTRIGGTAGVAGIRLAPSAIEALEVHGAYAREFGPPIVPDDPGEGGGDFTFLAEDDGYGTTGVWAQNGFGENLSGSIGGHTEIAIYIGPYDISMRVYADSDPGENLFDIIELYNTDMSGPPEITLDRINNVISTLWDDDFGCRLWSFGRTQEQDDGWTGFEDGATYIGVVS